MKNDRIYERVEGYHAGTLTASERLRYEEDLKTDTTLLDLHTTYVASTMIIEEVIGQDLRRQLRSWETERPVARRIRLPGWFRYAAVILLLVLAGGYWWTQRNDGDNVDLMANYYHPPIYEQLRGGPDDPTSDTLQMVYTYLSEGQAETALDWLNQIEHTPEINTEMRWLRAHAAFQTNNFELAERELRQLTSIYEEEPRRLEPAEWLLALTEVAQTGAVTPLLETLAADEYHQFYESARRLREQLR